MTDLVPCPHCGEWIRETAKACRYCGSDHETGWASQEDIDMNAFEIPDSLPEDFDYDEERSKRLGFRLFVGFVALLIIGVFLRFDARTLGTVFIVAGGFVGTLWILTKLSRRSS